MKQKVVSGSPRGSSLMLPLVARHETALEKCVYCPKLSRAACPVSNVEANETVTPWGKMSMAFFVARGDVPHDRAHAEPAWACSACYACRERCDHKNEVATVLVDARAEAFAAGAAPEAARAVASGWNRRAVEIAGRARAIASEHVSSVARGAAGRRGALLVGCSYLRHAPDVALDALRIAETLLDRPMRLLQRCCGLPLLYAGDRAGFDAAARALVDEIGEDRAVVWDPGCARAMLVEYPRISVTAPRAELLVDVIAASLDRIRPEPSDPTRAPRGEARPRYAWHDPCQLGRGLDRYEAPRAILSRLAGELPAELAYHRHLAACSGGGGLLPATRPATSRAIADARIAEHRATGASVLVTACGASLHRFRTRGQRAEDLLSLVARRLAPAR